MTQLLALWKTSQEMADACGVPMYVAHKWRYYKRIPSDSLALVVKAAAQQGITISVEHLLQLNAPMKRRGRPPLKRRSVRRQRAHA